VERPETGVGSDEGRLTARQLQQQQKKSTTTAAARATAAGGRQARESSESAAAMIADSVIDKAVKNGDVNAVMEAVEANHTKETIEAIRRGLDFLNEEGRYREVARLVEAMAYKSRHLRIIIRETLTAMLDSGLSDQVLAYIERMPEEDARNVRTDSILRLAKLKADTEGFIQTLQSADVEEGRNRKEWLLDPKSLEKIFQSSPNLETQLEKLATSGCLAANVLMGRLACCRADKDKFMKHWDHDTRENRRAVARDMIVDVHTVDRLRWINDTLREGKVSVDVLDVGVNQCLNRVKTDQELLAATNLALSYGVGLDTINTASLKRLLRMDNFKPKVEVDQILAKRAAHEAKAAAAST